MSLVAGDLHGLRECIKGFVEVVHLCEDTDEHDDDEDVCGGVSELVVAVRSQLQGNTEGFRGHDRHRSSGCTDRKVVQGVLSPISWANAVDHDTRVSRNSRAKYQEAYQFKSVLHS